MSHTIQHMTLLANSPEVLAEDLVRVLKLYLIYALSLTSDLLKTLGPSCPTHRCTGAKWIIRVGILHPMRLTIPSAV